MKVSEKTRTVSASIGLDDYDKLVKFANEEGTTTSDIIRIALIQLFERSKRKNGRSKDSESIPRRLEDLDDMKEIRTISDELEEQERRKEKDEEEERRENKEEKQERRRKISEKQTQSLKRLKDKAKEESSFGSTDRKPEGFDKPENMKEMRIIEDKIDKDNFDKKKTVELKRRKDLEPVFKTAYELSKETESKILD